MCRLKGRRLPKPLIPKPLNSRAYMENLKGLRVEGGKGGGGQYRIPREHKVLREV